MTIEPGVYFGLDEAAYHADAALGSTDMKRLAFSPCDYWFGSPLNPRQPSDDPTPQQLFGRAVHKLVAEGTQAFEGAYAPRDLNGTTRDGKAESAAIANAGKIGLKRAEYDRILFAGEMIRANPHLSEAFHGGAAEVSIFWERDGIRRKCRIDYLKQRASVDLKSIRNTRGIDFSEACRCAIAEWRYDIQAAHYNEGREAARRLIAAGAVHDGVEFDRKWLRAIAEAPEWAFVFIFYQAEGAPLTWGTALSPGNPILDFARTQIERAENNYRTFMSRFGPATPWLLNEPLDELDINAMPAWFGRAA